MNQMNRNLLLWGVIVLAMAMLFNMFQQPQSGGQRVPYTDFLAQVESGQILSVTMQGNTLIGKTSDNTTIQTYAPPDSGLVQRLLEKKVVIKAEPPEGQPWYMALLVSWFPMLLFIGVWVFFMRQMQGGSGKAMSFGRSRARLLNQDGGARVTFADVAGVDEAKEEAAFVLQYLQDYDISYPVIFEMEHVVNDTARIDVLTKEDKTQITKAFIDDVETAGYNAMFSGDKAWLFADINYAALSAYDVRLEQTEDLPDYPYRFYMWQYTQKGTVDGISGEVPLNICFIDYTIK